MKFDQELADRIRAFRQWADPKLRYAKNKLGRVDPARVIDRCFRFLEMSLLAALVGLVYSIVDPQWALIVSLAMSLAAGIYLALPLVSWWLGGKQSKSGLLVMSAIFGASAAALVFPVQTLVRSTINIDRSLAMREYAQAQGTFAAMACMRARRSVEQCEAEAQRVEAEILNDLRPNMD